MYQLEIRSISDSNPFSKVIDADGVSLTANNIGFTPFCGVRSAYDWPERQEFTAACNACNKRRAICVIPDINPTAFLVPKTHGRLQDDYLIDDLMNAVEHMKIRKLHFTHFFYLCNRLPADEITVILRSINKRNTQNDNTIITIVFDIAKNHEESFKKLVDKHFCLHV